MTFVGAAFNEQAEKIEKLQEALQLVRTATLRLFPYREHNRYCEIGSTDFCTCGLREAADAVRNAFNSADKYL